MITREKNKKFEYYMDLKCSKLLELEQLIKELKQKATADNIPIEDLRIVVQEGDMYGPNGREDYLIAIAEREETHAEYLAKLIKERDTLNKYLEVYTNQVDVAQKQLADVEEKLKNLKNENT